jgi:hypothetical protein
MKLHQTSNLLHSYCYIIQTEVLLSRLARCPFGSKHLTFQSYMSGRLSDIRHNGLSSNTSFFRMTTYRLPVLDRVILPGKRRDSISRKVGKIIRNRESSKEIIELTRTLVYDLVDRRQSHLWKLTQHEFRYLTFLRRKSLDG